MLVILYSCGLRRNEAVNLEVSDILFDAGRVFVRKGKNYKERYVPINKYSLRILEEYLYESRPAYLQHTTESLLLSRFGTPLKGGSMAIRLNHLIALTGDELLQQKNITPHSLRHSIATHLLQQGMQIEDIRQFLGHSSLKSTQVYTHLIESI